MLPNLSERVKPIVLVANEQESEPSMDWTQQEDRDAAPAVWGTNMLMSGKNLFGFSCEGYERNPEEFVNNLVMIERGEPVPDSFVPDLMWADDASDDRRQRFPQFFFASSYLVVSEKLANLLRQFDLAASRLSPVTLLHRQRKLPFAGTYLILDLRERKEAFEPEHSRHFTPRLFPDQKHIGSVSGRPQDGGISVSKDALRGADLWHDPRLLKSIFFSDRLMTAMEKAKVLGGVRAFRCPLVMAH